MEDENRSLPQSGGNYVTSAFSHWFSFSPDICTCIYIYNYIYVNIYIYTV